MNNIYYCIIGKTHKDVYIDANNTVSLYCTNNSCLAAFNHIIFYEKITSPFYNDCIFVKFKSDLDLSKIDHTKRCEMYKTLRFNIIKIIDIKKVNILS